MVILQPGKLGNTQERVELSIEFQRDYVSPRQTQMEEVLNEILGTIYQEDVILKKAIV